MWLSSWPNVFWLDVRILLFTAWVLVRSFWTESNIHGAKLSTVAPRTHTAEPVVDQVSENVVPLRQDTRLRPRQRKLARTELAVAARVTLVLVPSMGIAARNMDTVARRAVTAGWGVS